MVRVGLLQDFDDGAFAIDVNFAHEVGRSLGMNFDRIEVLAGTRDDGASSTSSLDGDIEHCIRRHKISIPK